MRKLPLSILLFFFISVNAQEILTLNDAIQIALNNEPNIALANNQSRIAQLQNNWGNAGLLPTVGVNAGFTGGIVNSHQAFSNGTEQDRNNARSTAINAGVNVNWTVFDGLKMFAVKKRLALTEGVSMLQAKLQTETVIANVMNAYYDIVRIQEQIKTAKQNLALYDERKKLAKLKFDVGTVSKVDLLQSQTDINRVKSDLLQYELQLINAKASMNNLLYRAMDFDFIINDSITVNYKPNLADLKKNNQNNTQLKIYQQNEAIALQQLKEAKAIYFPTIQLNGNYNFVNNQNQAGFVSLNRQYGLNGGVALNWTIFNGLKNLNAIKEKQLLQLNSKLISQRSLQNIDAATFIQYQTFLTNESMMQLEQENVRDAAELMQIAGNRYKEGRTTMLETIEAQKTYEEALLRYINARYQTKKAEIELLRINGLLVGELVNK